MRQIQRIMKMLNWRVLEKVRIFNITLVLNTVTKPIRLNTFKTFCCVSRSVVYCTVPNFRFLNYKTIKICRCDLSYGYCTVIACLLSMLAWPANRVKNIKVFESSCHLPICRSRSGRCCMGLVFA